MKTLKKAWVWLKNYWYIPFILVVAALGYVFMRRNNVDWRSVLDDARERKKKEIDAIERAHEEEQAAKKKAFERMEAARQQLRDKYNRDMKELDKDKKREVERILKKTKDDPERMAEELRQSTGYDVFVVK